jgi:hypothetical protein
MCWRRNKLKTHNHINYIEIPAKDLPATKNFLEMFSVGNLSITARTIAVSAMKE